MCVRARHGSRLQPAVCSLRVFRNTTCTACLMKAEYAVIKAFKREKKPHKKPQSCQRCFGSQSNAVYFSPFEWHGVRATVLITVDIGYFQNISFLRHNTAAPNFPFARVGRNKWMVTANDLQWRWETHTVFREMSFIWGVRLKWTRIESTRVSGGF